MAKVEHFAKFADERMEKEVKAAKGGKEGEVQRKRKANGQPSEWQLPS